MDKDRFMEWYSIVGACVCFLAVLFFGLSIHFYPGGSYRDHTRDGFFFMGNTISDLGRIIAVNGEPNPISRTFYILGLTTVSFFTFGFYLKMISIFKDKKIIKWVSLVGSIFGFIQSIAYFIIPFVSVDVNFVAHNKMIFIAAPFLFATIFVYIFVFFLGKKLPKINVYSFLGLAISAVALATAITVGAIKGGPINEIIRRSGHTLFIFISTFVNGLQFIGLYIYIKNNRIKEEKSSEIISQKELDTTS
ncbi:MAG: hypothetical protein FK733_06800 [Asgard group archaeon]|nr:hypothetical protein [Asgard group archaeon]